MAQPTMMVPLQLSGSLPKVTGEKAIGTLSSASGGDLEGRLFSQALQDQMETGNDNYALILAMQLVTLTPEGAPVSTESGSLLPSVAAVSGSALPLNGVQLQPLPAQQTVSLGEVKVFEPEQLQMILPDGKLPVKETTQLLVATAQVTDDLIVSGTQGLRDADGQLQAIGSVGQPQLASVNARPVFALPMQVPVGQPGWDNSLGERLHWMVSQHVQQAEIKLTPPDLGPLEIKITMHNDQTNVSFVASHVATRDALEAAIPRLREMFNEANLNLGHVDVGQQQAGGTAGGEARGSNGGQSGEGGELTPLGQVSVESTMHYASRGLLDTYV